MPGGTSPPQLGQDVPAPVWDPVLFPVMGVRAISLRGCPVENTFCPRDLLPGAAGILQRETPLVSLSLGVLLPFNGAGNPLWLWGR